MYDALHGRWVVQGAIADLYLGLTPYNYVGNNPVSYIDPNSLYLEGVNGFKSQRLIGWIRDPNGKVYFDPNVHGPDDLPEGAGTYIGEQYLWKARRLKTGMVIYNSYLRFCASANFFFERIRKDDGSGIPALLFVTVLLTVYTYGLFYSVELLAGKK